MPFSDTEKAQLLALKGVGATVVSRLEQLGFSSLMQLSDQNVETITRQIADLIGSSCWQNSPMAKGAIAAVIDLARSTAK